MTAKILNFDGTVQNAGGILHHPDGSFTIPHANEDRLAPPVTRQTEVQNAGGPCMLLTRGLLDEVGVFDEAYSPAYFEDSDLCQRARAAGFVLLYEPRAEVLHHGKATANVVAREGTLDVWGGFEANRRRFHERWREQLAADEASRREPPAARKKILLCYGREATTTAAYCEAALRRSHDVVTAGPGQELDLGDVTAAELVREAGGADLLLAIEGRNYLPREVEGAPCPTAWWAIDAHLHARAEEEGYFEVARAFEHVFLAQRDHARSFAARGIETTWLPLACDPDVHVPGEAPKDLDVVFLGNVLPIHGRRRALLERLRRRFRVHATRGVYREDMARLYSRARVVWNCSLAGDLNMRVFEALASGTVLVTDRIANGLEAFFAHGEHLLLYDDGDLEEVVAGALAEPRASAEIAARGQRLVTRHHTYAHRMADVVRIATRRREGAHVSRSPRHSSTASGSTRSRSASRS